MIDAEEESTQDLLHEMNDQIALEKNGKWRLHKICTKIITYHLVDNNCNRELQGFS